MINITSEAPIIGIYKFTSPSGKIYIGQAINIYKRWKSYKHINNGQIKLYNSFQKYGIENHKFEIVEECDLEQLNEREIYWGNYYNVLGESGLNLRELGDKGKISQETRSKMSISAKNKCKMTNFTKAKMSESKKNNQHALGYKHSNLSKIKMSECRKGRIVSDVTKLKISKSKKGKINLKLRKPRSKEHNAKFFKPI